MLAALPQPLALLEVGASAGLCLLPDRYGYHYSHRPGPGPDVVLPGSPVLRCAMSPSTPIPTRHPDIVWRAGLDLNPSMPATPRTGRGWRRWCGRARASG